MAEHYFNNIDEKIIYNGIKEDGITYLRDNQPADFEKNSAKFESILGAVVKYFRDLNVEFKNFHIEGKQDASDYKKLHDHIVNEYQLFKNIVTEKRETYENSLGENDFAKRDIERIIRNIKNFDKN